MQEILITGGAGYIGSHTAFTLVKKGYKVIVIDDLSNSYLETRLNNVKYYIGDIADINLLNKIFSDNEIQSVIHFAGSISVSESMDNPDKYFENNTHKTKILTEVMKQKGVKNIIFSSTAALYGNISSGEILESAEIKPINPYGESKMLSEKQIFNIGLNYVFLRYFNVAGSNTIANLGYNPKSKWSHLIPVISKAYIDSLEFSIFGTDYKTPDGSAIRDYVHVQDLADAHVLALEYLIETNQSNTFNLGNNKGISVKEIVSTTEKITNSKLNVVNKPRRSGDPEILLASNRKAKEILGWEPKKSIEDMIESNIQYLLKGIK